MLLQVPEKIISIYNENHDFFLYTVTVFWILDCVHILNNNNEKQTNKKTPQVGYKSTEHIVDAYCIKA